MIIIRGGRLTTYYIHLFRIRYNYTTALNFVISDLYNRTLLSVLFGRVIKKKNGKCTMIINIYLVIPLRLVKFNNEGQSASKSQKLALFNKDNTITIKHRFNETFMIILVYIVMLTSVFSCSLNIPVIILCKQLKFKFVIRF